jgi:hypothetical protein
MADLTSVARLLAKVDPFDWPMPRLEQFSKFIAMPKSDNDEKQVAEGGAEAPRRTNKRRTFVRMSSSLLSPPLAWLRVPPLPTVAFYHAKCR